MLSEWLFSRYNVQQPDSDIDAFIVYQAHTKDLLGFNPPKMTIKVGDGTNNLDPQDVLTILNWDFKLQMYNTKGKQFCML